MQGRPVSKLKGSPFCCSVCVGVCLRVPSLVVIRINMNYCICLLLTLGCSLREGLVVRRRPYITNGPGEIMNVSFHLPSTNDCLRVKPDMCNTTKSSAARVCVQAQLW